MYLIVRIPLNLLVGHFGQIHGKWPVATCYFVFCLPSIQPISSSHPNLLNLSLSPLHCRIIIVINLRVLTKKSSVIGQPKQLDLVKVSEGAADSKPNQSGWSGGGGGAGGGGGGEVNRGQSYGGRGAMTNGVNSSTTTPYSSRYSVCVLRIRNVSTFLLSLPSTFLLHLLSSLPPPFPFSGTSPPKPVGMNTSSLSQRNVFPISSLNPYQNRFVHACVPVKLVSSVLVSWYCVCSKLLLNYTLMR